jgi:hypothetical protein
LGGQTYRVANDLAKSYGSRINDEARLAIALPANDTVGLYGLLELNVQTDIPSVNPYDPDDIELKVSFSAASGREVQVSAFWYQGYDSFTRKPSGKAVWRVRFTPDEVGKWMAVAYTPKLGLHSIPISFSVKPSTNPGFICVNQNNPHYLGFDDGGFFSPSG